MPVKELNAVYKDKKICVENTWFSGIKLFVDGECRDFNNKLIETEGRMPVLSATLDIEGKNEVLNVYAKAILTTKLQIWVDNDFIAGDKF